MRHVWVPWNALLLCAALLARRPESVSTVAPVRIEQRIRPVYIQVSFGPTQGIFVHWREAVAVICSVILGITWILDIVHIAKGQFRDREKLTLK